MVRPSSRPGSVPLSQQGIHSSLVTLNHHLLATSTVADGQPRQAGRALLATALHGLWAHVATLGENQSHPLQAAR